MLEVDAWITSDCGEPVQKVTAGSDQAPDCEGPGLQLATLFEFPEAHTFENVMAMPVIVGRGR